MINRIGSRLVTAGLVCAALLTAGCEHPPMDAEQLGFRGTAMEQVTNPRRVADAADLHVVPEPLPAVPDSGPRASEIYQNVQVLGDLSVGQFTRVMAAITQWVSPEEGCNYCHEGGNFASDAVYTKVVTRSMLQMTAYVNTQWEPHVGGVGVTCYTCHRGKHIPANVWYIDPQENTPRGLMANPRGQNRPDSSVAYSSLPYDPFTPYLLGDTEIRIQGGTALPTGNDNSIEATEMTYGLMMHMSDGLGVNCTYCHNSRAMGKWEQSTPMRVTAWHGIRMARDLNNAYMVPLTDVFPDDMDRKGPTGDVLKVNCATCHNGIAKPLNGVSMAADYPELNRASLSPVSTMMSLAEEP